MRRAIVVLQVAVLILLVVAHAEGQEAVTDARAALDRAVEATCRSQGPQ